MSEDIKELQELVEQEKLAEQKIAKAKEDAQSILKSARERAESIIQAVDSDPVWPKLRQSSEEKRALRKTELEEEFRRTIALLNKTAEQTFAQAVDYVVKETMRVNT